VEVINNQGLFRELILNLELDESLVYFTKELKKTLLDDWDMVLALTGVREGVGKSTLEILLGYLVDKDFDLEKNMSYLPTTKEIEEKFYALNQYQLLGIDEAIKILYKLKWMDRLQVAINEMYATERKQNKATALCIPRIRDLNEQFRNHKVNINIHIVARGYAIVFRRDDFNFASVDPWHLKETDKLLEKLRMNRKIMEIGLEERMSIYRKCPTYWFDFVFPPLPKPIFDKYKDIGIQKRKERLDIAVEETKRVAFILHQHGVAQSIISKGLNIPQSTLSDWLIKAFGNDEKRLITSGYRSS
jgi:predicted XRE-type DNA-binding protein